MTGWFFGWVLITLVESVLYLMGIYQDANFTRWTVLVATCMATFSFYFEMLINMLKDWKVNR